MTEPRKTARRPRPQVRLEALEDRTMPSVSVVEGFEGADLSAYQTALRYAPSAVLLPVAAHDGLQGLVKQDGYEWLIRNDAATQVHPGDTVSVWTQLANTADGRAYLGFDARDNGTLHSPLTDGGMLSVVMAANTGQLAIQNNNGFNEPVSNASSAVAATAPGSVAYQADHWYRLEAVWGAANSITANLYDSDGTTLIATVTGTTTPQFPAGGGVALRAFGHDKYFDTVVVDAGSTGTLADRANAGGGLDPNWQPGNPPPPVGNNQGGGPAPVPYQYTSTPGSGRDVSLAAFNDLQQVSSGGIVGGVVGLAAQNLSAVGGTQQVGWGPPAFGRYNSGIPIETPLLAQYLFRQLPGAQTRLIGSSDVKHFFSSAHSDSHHLNPGEQDTYGSGLNMNQTLYTDGSEIDPVTGSVHSAVDLGHNDPDNVTVGDNLTYRNNIQHLLQVNVADLDPAQNPAGTRWFLMGNLFVAGDSDVSNNSRWVEVAPHYSGTAFTFTYPNGTAGQLDFHTIPGLGSVAGEPLVANGGFETGDFSGWTQSGDTSYTGVGGAASTPPVPVHGGAFAAFFGPNGAGLGYLTQTLATAAGTTYTLSFWLAHPSTDAGTEWQVSVGGTVLSDVADAANFSYTHFTFTFTATGAATDLQFGFHEPPNYFYLDDVSVTAGGSTLLVANGGFETGDFTGWTQSGDTSYTSAITGTPDGRTIHSGTHAAQTGPSTGLGYLSQTLATTAGTSYTLSFWLSHPSTDVGTEWQVSVGGTVLTDVLDAGNFNYTQYTFTFAATGTATDLQFGFHEPPSYFFLDDVSVTPVVPLVANGGFETGSFSGWSQSGDTGSTAVGNATTLAGLGGSAHGGSYAAYFGPAAALGYLSQTLATTAGTGYTLSFWLAHPFTDSGTEWQVSVGGTVLTDVVDAGNFGYTRYTFTFTATGSATPLQFGFHEPPSYFFLDDVSVVQASDTEPPLAPGPGGEGGSVRRSQSPLRL